MALTTTAAFDPILSDMLDKIGMNDFPGLRILPPAERGISQGKYPIFDAEQFDNDSAKKRAPGTKFSRRDFKYGQQSFDTEQYGEEGVLPDEDANQADQDGISDARGAIAKFLRRDLLVGHDRRVADVVYNAAFNSTSATAAMSSNSTAKPIEDMQNAVERLKLKGFTDNLKLVIESSLWQEFKNTDDVREIFNGNGQFFQEQVLRDAIGIDEIIICNSAYNSAAKGKSASRTKIWPTDKYLIGRITGGDFANGGFGRTIAYNENGGVFSAEEYRDETIKADVLRVYNAVDEVISNTLEAELITGV